MVEDSVIAIEAAIQNLPARPPKSSPHQHEFAPCVDQLCSLIAKEDISPRLSSKLMPGRQFGYRKSPAGAD